MITYRRLALSEKTRLVEVDRSEHIAEAYRQHGADLELVAVDWRAPAFSLPTILENWDAFLRDDCQLWGAFDEAVLVGFCGYQPDIAPGTGRFALLHVGKAHRRRGIGRRLAELLIAHAREQGVATLYLTATPTRGTVDFYRSLGFHPTDAPLPELLMMEPDDIHMRMVMASA